MDTGKIKRYWGAYGNEAATTRNYGPYNPDAPLVQQFRNPVHCAEPSNDGLVYVCDRAERSHPGLQEGRQVREGEASSSRRRAATARCGTSRSRRIRSRSTSSSPTARTRRSTSWTAQSLEILTSFGDGGRQPGQFFAVHSIATDSKGNIYTTETYEGKRVQKFVYKGMATVEPRPGRRLAQALTSIHGNHTGELMRGTRFILALGAIPGVVGAQATKQAGAPADIPPAAQQVAAAVLALPTEYREGAKVLGYRAGTKGFVTLREGTGPFTCLANDPARKEFHVACYHRSMEPFMARGRELRASGVKGDSRVDTVALRRSEVRQARRCRSSPRRCTSCSAAHSMRRANTVKATRSRCSSIYISGATGGIDRPPDETGARATPWIMFPGTPKAHIMLTPKM